MKKINVIAVALLSLSLLTGCTTNKIERSEQDINQEKVEKAKKEIASENKREKASSTKLIIPNSNESTQTESTQTESTQTESTQTEGTQTEGTQTESTQTESTQTERTQTESTQTESTQETTIDQQWFPNAIAPSWWRECNANGHRVTQGVDTQSGKYYWCCDDCGKGVCYEKCNEHNTPATPEHMQLHLN